MILSLEDEAKRFKEEGAYLEIQILYFKVVVPTPFTHLFTQLFPLQVLEDKLPLYFPRD